MLPRGAFKVGHEIGKIFNRHSRNGAGISSLENNLSKAKETK